MSFRQFGGLNYAAKHNIVSSNYNTSNNLLVTQNVGQPNSYINFLSDISGNISVYGDFDLSGNLNVSGNIYGNGSTIPMPYVVESGTLVVVLGPGDQGNIRLFQNVLIPSGYNCIIPNITNGDFDSQNNILFSTWVTNTTPKVDIGITWQNCYGKTRFNYIIYAI
jgi:hypothetical protein